jgi:hypothetical protein
MTASFCFRSPSRRVSDRAECALPVKRDETGANAARYSGVGISLCAPVYFRVNDPEFLDLIKTNQGSVKNYTHFMNRGIDSRQNSDNVLFFIQHGPEKRI